MAGRRRSAYYVRPLEDDLPDGPALPEGNRITEAELFMGYSGLVARRRRPNATAETVRRRYSLAYGPTAGDGVDGPEPIASPEEDPAEAAP